MANLVECSTSEQRQLVFHSFPLLHEDLGKQILSFVAEAPLESSTAQGNEYTQAPLTHILPFVNKAFREWSSLDVFWQPCLHRQLTRKDRARLHWQAGLRRLLPMNFDDDKDCDLLDEVVKHIGDISYKDFYKKVMTSHIRCDYPVFIMPCELQLGHLYGLHLFEPRYRFMVRSLLEKCCNPEEVSQGEIIKPACRDGVLQIPFLIHASLGTRLGPGELACLVQLLYCQTYEYGTADVQLMPIEWVRLDKLWVQPSSGHLFYAQVTRTS